MASQYFAALFLFISYNAQCMDIAHCSQQIKEVKKDEFVMCIVPMVMLLNRDCPEEYLEKLCRENWSNYKSVRQKFKTVLRNPQPITRRADVVVGDEFVAEMVPRMMGLNKHGWSKGDCEVVARLLWRQDAECRMEYQKVKQRSAAQKTLDNLPEHPLNIIGKFTKRSGKDTLRCVSKALNEKVISQDELYECYNEAQKLINTDLKKTEINRLLCYNRFIPQLKYEMLEAIKDKNIPFIDYFFKKYDFTNLDLYGYFEAAMKNYSPDIGRILMRVDIINRVDRSGFTVLHHAVNKGNIELVKAIIFNPSIDINKQDGWGRTALFLAAQNIKPFVQSSYDMVTFLLGAHADPGVAAVYKNRIPLDVVRGLAVKARKKVRYASWVKNRKICNDKQLDFNFTFIITYLIRQAIAHKRIRETIAQKRAI